MCKLKIGMMEWRPYKKRSKVEPKLALKKQVGQWMSVTVSVCKDATASTLRDKALQAFKLVDHDMDESQQVEFLPGQSKERFTPHKYIELVGTFYSKVRLYLVSEKDWRASSIYNTKYQPLDETSGSELEDHEPRYISKEKLQSGSRISKTYSVSYVKAMIPPFCIHQHASIIFMNFASANGLRVVNLNNQPVQSVPCLLMVNLLTFGQRKREKFFMKMIKVACLGKTIYQKSCPQVTRKMMMLVKLAWPPRQ